jgi:hypothetical protein
MPERYLHLCPARGGDVPESILLESEHILLECPCWECHRRSFGTLALWLKDFLRQFATCREDMAALL